ncbi:hypothetical protein PENTCL1PPCAC_12104, partial [Pristionchus entomophagus]
SVMANESFSVSEKCLICSTPNASIHFGIDACRACASFFKRVQLSGRRFPCRRGDHNCPVQRGSGSMCRGCRYDRCATVGMEYDGPMKMTKLSTSQNAMEVSLPCTSRHEDSLLNRIAREHALCLERRRICELELVKRHDLVRLPHPTEEIYLVEFDCGVASFNVAFIEFSHVFLACFPSIKALPYSDQRELFRQCMQPFSMIESFFRSKRIFGGFNKYAMCSVLMCNDIDRPEAWAGHQTYGPIGKELLEMIRAYIDDLISLIGPSFEKADITEREAQALLPLLLCESDLQGDDRYQSILDEIRNEILNDLRRFYTEEMGLSEYSTRLGNLFTLCHICRESNAKFQEFFRMQVTVFDLYVTETLLKDMIL